MKHTPKLEEALWRYSIISPLLHRQANDVLLREMLDELGGKFHCRPDGTRTIVKPETIRKWFYRYRDGGLQALEDKQRSDKGKCEVSLQIADTLFALREKHEAWTFALILKVMIEQKIWDETRPSRSTLYRFARANNLLRAPQSGSDIVQPFTFEKFGQLWIADFMHGPKLWAGKTKKKSYLHVIIDDCTRYIVSAQFYRAENIESLAHALMTAIRRFGITHRFYTDNGAAYRSHYLKTIGATLGMQLPHTPPYRPQGRSKGERFFRTVREQFLAKKCYGNFDEINRELPMFLNDYHNRIHSTLKCTPMQKRLSVESVCKPLPEVADIEALFRDCSQCKVYKDGTIRIKRRQFEVAGCIPGSKVMTYFMPWDLSRVYYGDDMQLAREVDLVANAHRFDNPNFSK